MESAIPAHLSVQRVHPPRTSRSFHPPYPSFSARFDPGVEQVVMAYLGVQYATPKPPTVVSIALAELFRVMPPRRRGRPNYQQRGKATSTSQLE